MPFQRILVAIDGSPGGQKALETAIELGENRGRLAQRTGGRRAATAVCGHDRRGRRGEAGEGRVLRDACSTGTGASAGGRGRARSRRPSRHAADLIVRYANQGGFDLVVVGHKGHLLEDYLLLDGGQGRPPRLLPRDDRQVATPKRNLATVAASLSSSLPPGRRLG